MRVLLLALLWIALVFAVAMVLGALARRADRLEERHTSSRARARRMALRRGMGRRTHTAAFVRLRLFHRTGSPVDQWSDEGRPDRRPER
jgi:hypothetical protein